MDGAERNPDSARRGFVAGAAALGLALLAGCAERRPYAAVGTPFPPFRLVDIDDREYAGTDYSGIALIANFWATWCPPCRREMPSMERLYQKLTGEPFMVLAPDQYENFDLVFSFTGQLDPAPTFPIMLDPKSTASKTWKVKGLPTSFIVDKKGRIAYRAVGGREFDHPEIEKLIRDLIKE